MKHITFDLETIGNTPNAPIVQIGAVKFTESDIAVDWFQRHVDLKSLEQYDFHVDYETLGWWFSQKDEAIKSVFCQEDTMSLRQALYEFQEWIKKPSKYVFWSHATFDPPILDNNFRQVGLKNPIPFRNHRDIRTLNHFAGKPDKDGHNGIVHNAMDDAEFQAKYIVAGIRKLKNDNSDVEDVPDPPISGEILEDRGLPKIESKRVNDHEEETVWGFDESYKVVKIHSWYGGKHHTEWIMRNDFDDIFTGYELKYLNQLEDLWKAVTGTKLGE